MTEDNNEIKKLRLKISELGKALKEYKEAFDLQIGDMNSFILNLIKYNNRKRKIYFIYRGNYYYPDDLYIDDNDDLIFELREI